MSLNLNDAVSENLAEANAMDNSLSVRFYMGKKLDEAKTAEEGRPIYKQREHVIILVPGDKLSKVDRPVMHSDKIRFPVQYARFKNNVEQEITGTPLAAWPSCTEAQRAELEHFNIRTVEQLANMPDANAQGMMGIITLKNAAKKFIEQARDNAATEKLNKALAERDARMAELLAKLEDATDRIKDLEAVKPVAKGK